MLKKLLLVPVFAAMCAFAQTIPTEAYNDVTYVHNLSIGTVTTGAPGTPARAVVNNSPTGSVLSITVPQGLRDGSIVPGLTLDGRNGFVLTGNMQASRINSLRYAASYQTDTENNRIANASAGANGQVVIVDSSYGITEQPVQGSFSAQGFHFQDNRNGQMLDFFRNPTYSATGTIPNPLQFGLNTSTITAHNWTCLFDITPASLYGLASPSGNTTTKYGCDQTNYTRINPGWSIGNPGFSVYGWNTDLTHQINSTINGSGISEYLLIQQHKQGVGDNIPLYVYTYGEGGWTAPSDQGMQGIANNVTEDPQAYVGRSTVTATGPRQIGSTAQGGTGGLQGTERYLTDVGACSSYPTCPTAPYVGTVTNVTSGLDGVGSALTISGTVPVSSAWGTLASSVNVPVVTVPPFTTSETFNVNIESGTFDTKHLACIDSNSHEQAIPTAVGTPSGGVQSVTIPWRRAHAAGGHLYQGGMCGYGIEFPAFDQKPLNVKLRYLFDIVGSTGANTLQTVKFSGGSTFPIPVNIPILNINSGLTNGGSGTTVTGTNAGGGMYEPWFATNHGTILISGASDLALNALCTSVLWSSISTFTCTVAGLSGSHTSTTSATALQTNAAGVSLNTYNLRPIAEVLDVRNNSVSPPVVDGTFTLESNVIPMVRGDWLEETHHYAQRVDQQFNSLYIQNPYTTFAGSSTQARGAGLCCGGTSESYNAFLNYSNLNPDSMYLEGGGFLSPPNFFNLQGNYYEGFLFDHGPSPFGSIINVRPSSTQRNDPNYAENLIQGAGNGYFYHQYFPSTSKYIFLNSGATDYWASAHTFHGSVTFNNAVTMPLGSTIGGQAPAPIASPAFKGIPTAPTAAPGTKTTQIATMAALQAGLQTIVVPSANPTSTQQIGQVSLGGLQNYIQNAATMTGSGWGTNGTVRGGQTDPYGGTNAVSLTTTAKGQVYQEIPSTPDLVSGVTYVTCGWLKGAVGGESFGMGIGGDSLNPTFTTSWQYSGPNVVTPISNLNVTWKIASLVGKTQTVYLYGWTVTPGNSCPAFLPTGDSPVTSPTQQMCVNGTCINPVTSVQLPLTGTTGSIGGSALTSGTCASGAVTVTGATNRMAIVVTPVTYPGDSYTWKGYVSATNTVTVKVCANLAAGGTPTASTYNVRVIQ
jgi:hypothetical protein